MEHRDGIEKKSEEGPFHVYNTEKHDGVDEGVAGFEMKVIGRKITQQISPGVIMIF